MVNVHAVSQRSFWVPWFQGDPPVNLYFRNENKRIIFMTEICENIRIFHKLRPTDRVIVMIPWSVEDNFMIENHRRVVTMWGLDTKNFCIMANEAKQMDVIREHGFDTMYCNQNCFIDENLWYPTGEEKKFNAILNSKLVKWKRNHLANEVDDVIMLAGLDSKYNDVPLDQIKCQNIKTDFIFPEDIRSYINQSKVGLMLSAEEGANWATGEYLLCGIPVVSTKSVGGREVWMDDYNSIICEPTEDAVKNATNEMIARNVDPRIIRNNYLKLSKKFRQTFINHTKRILSDFGLNVDANALFKENFVDKLPVIRKHNYEGLCNLLD